MDAFAYVDQPRPGWENMAIDQRMLETADRRGCALVRIYRWSEPTLSLGHFQAGIDRRVHTESAQLPVVVRASGGGAIVHHHEWTYAVAMPMPRTQVGASRKLYDCVHGAIVAGLRELGWDAAVWNPSREQPGSASGRVTEGEKCSVPATVRQAAAPFLCFERRTCGDIVCGGFKVVGSAQRRSGGSILQHGGILCASSCYAPSLLGLDQLPRPLSFWTSPGFASRGLEPQQVDWPAMGPSVLAWVKQGLLEEFGGLAFGEVAAELTQTLSQFP